jgi:transcription elongation GreA/GreB family factor
MKTYLLRKTIEVLRSDVDRLEKEMLQTLEREIGSKTGGDNWHNPNKVIQESKQRILDEKRQWLRMSSSVHMLSPMKKVDVGAVVMLRGADHTVQYLHVGTFRDTATISSLVNKGNRRIISVESPAGSAIVGKSVGDRVVFGKNSFGIERISVSPFA